MEEMRAELKPCRMSGKEKKDVSRKLGTERSDFSQEYGKQCWHWKIIWY